MPPAIAAAPGPAAQAAQVTLNVWTIDFQNQYMFPLAKEFEKLHPDITINVKHVQFQDMNNDLARASITGDAPGRQLYRQSLTLTYFVRGDCCSIWRR